MKERPKKATAASARGSLFVISAPSGAGKTTICRQVVAADRRLRESVSFTTRSPRPGEVEGRDYHFVTAESFKKMVKRGEFVEWAAVHGNLYGTSKKGLRALMDAGFDVLLDIDTKGAQQFREVFPDGVFIFILPPSLAELRKRLDKRGANTKADAERRLRNATGELRRYKQYDYVIVNDSLEDAVGGLRAIIDAQRLRTEHIGRGWFTKHFTAQEDR